jgi:hypothetical protein
MRSPARAEVGDGVQAGRTANSARSEIVAKTRKVRQRTTAWTPVLQEHDTGRNISLGRKNL